MSLPRFQSKQQIPFQYAAKQPQQIPYQREQQPNNNQIPLMYQDNAPELKVEMQQPSNVRYWQWLSPLLFLLAILPALLLAIMGFDVHGPRKESVWNGFIGAGTWWLLSFSCFVWVVFH